MDKISAVISAYNSEKVLTECLESVCKWVDEIVVIDNSSIDQTYNIAKKYTSKIILRPNNTMLNVNKNFGFNKAEGPWILNLDSDEKIEENLESEIKERLKNWDGQTNGFFIPRKNFIFTRWIKHGGWYPDYQLRLFRKGKGKFPEEHVHEMLKIDGKAGYLKNHIIHKNYESIVQFLNKIPLYTQNEADQLIKKRYEFNFSHIFSFPIKEFISRFFAREGYKDGFHGLVLASLMSFYHLIIFLFIWEKNAYREPDKEEWILTETRKEIRKIHKELLFWITKQKIDNEKNKIKKIFLKVKKRFQFFLPNK